MSAVTKQEIVDALLEAKSWVMEEDDFATMVNNIIYRIEQHDIAPQDGWVLVPKKTTKAMSLAAEKSCWYDKANDRLFPEAVYAAMLAAAPEVT